MSDKDNSPQGDEEVQDTRTPEEIRNEESVRQRAVAAGVTITAAADEIHEDKLARVGESIDKIDQLDTKARGAHGAARTSAEKSMEKAKDDQVKALSELDDPNGKYTAFLWHGNVLRFGCNYCPFDTGHSDAMKRHVAARHAQPVEELGPARFDRWGRHIEPEEE